MKKAREGHVSRVRLIFPKGGPNSPREGVVEKERHMTCIIPPMVSPGQR